MPKKYSDDEIKKAMLQAHRESYEFWSRLIRSTTDPHIVKSLYRYREGFDHAIINVAKKLQIDLSRTRVDKENPPVPEDGQKGWSVRNGQIPVCSQCNTILFKMGRNVWNCAQCKVNYLIRDD
jgi:hypothetical protein